MECKEYYARSELLFGEEGMERLRRAHVILFGVGGVGGYAAEALARGGIGRLTLVDPDVVCPSNINRQLVANTDTIGQYKTLLMRSRILTINPDCVVTTRELFCLPENIGEFDFSSYDYVLDAIDTVRAKIAILTAARAAGTPAVSAMGAGNKLDPARLTVTDISETTHDPLARVMRTELRRRGITRLPVVFSDEAAAPHKKSVPPQANGKPVTGSASFVPGCAGLMMAGFVIRSLAGV